MEFRGKLVQFEISGRDFREIRDPMSGLLTSGCLGEGFRGSSERFRPRFLRWLARFLRWLAGCLNKDQEFTGPPQRLLSW